MIHRQDEKKSEKKEKEKKHETTKAIKTLSDQETDEKD